MRFVLNVAQDSGTLMGLDHQDLTYHIRGCGFRLTGVSGQNNLAPRLTEVALRNKML